MWPIAGVLLILLILLLTIPVNIVYALKKDGGWRGRILIYWMFGLVHMPVRPKRKRGEPKGRRRRKAGGLVRSTGRRLVRRRRDVLAVLRTPGFMRRLLDLLQDIIRSTRPRRARVEFVIGMDDPADTGRLWGMLAPFRLLFGRRTIGTNPNVSIEITPDFSGARFKGYSCASVRLVPLKMIGLMIGFFLSAPVLRAARALIQHSGTR